MNWGCRGHDHMMVGFTTTYAISAVSYLFIKQDQMILTLNSFVASLMLSQFLNDDKDFLIMGLNSWGI
jgi:hypothetical protein